MTSHEAASSKHDLHLAAIVLGCTVMPDGSPSDWLTDRLQCTAMFVAGVAAAVLHDTNPVLEQAHCGLVAPSVVNLLVVLTGGAVRSTVSEASCMSKWLSQRFVERDIDGLTADIQVERIAPASWKFSSPKSGSVSLVVQLYEEDKAQDTPGNMMHSLDVLASLFSIPRCCQTHETTTAASQPSLRRLALITSDFHLKRGATLLHQELTGNNVVSPFTWNDNLTTLTLGGDTKESIFERAHRFVCSPPHVESHSGEVQVEYFASPTPTLTGTRLEERKAREIMLIEQDSMKQKHRLAASSSSSATA